MKRCELELYLNLKNEKSLASEQKTISKKDLDVNENCYFIFRTKNLK